MLSHTDTDIAKSRADPRLRQVLLTKSLDQLLGALYRLQHDRSEADPASTRDLREGALMAVRLADLIRAIDERAQRAGTP